MDDINNDNKTSSNIRKRKWPVGVSVLAVIGVILIVYISTTNFGSSPSSVSRTYLSNTPKLVPGVAPGVAAQQSNNGQG